MSAYFESLNRRRAGRIPSLAPSPEPTPAATPEPAASRRVPRPAHTPRPISPAPPSAYGTLRERLLAAGNGKALTTVVFAGCDGSEGCTQVVREFAEVLAGSGLNVVVVEADRAAGAGVAGLGGPPPAREIGSGKLTVVPSPALPAEKEHFFGSPEFASWLDAQRSRYDYVLLDAPPLLKFADGTLMGRLADGLVVVVRAEVTQREALTRAREQLERAGVRVIGAVLNRAREVVPAPLRKFLSTE